MRMLDKQEITIYPIDPEDPYIAFKVNFNGILCSIKLLTIVAEEDDCHMLRFEFESGLDGLALPYDRVGGDKRIKNFLEISESQQKHSNNTA
jgi:hypothetical protein